MSEFINKQHTQFHQKLVSICGTRVAFEAKIVVDWQHIDRKADKDKIRANLGTEQLASVIRDGTLNLPLCKRVGGIARSEIVIEGKFKDFPWLDPSTMIEATIQVLYIRVVIKEGRGAGQHIVVTAYDLWSENINPAVNEVSYEIW